MDDVLVALKMLLDKGMLPTVATALTNDWVRLQDDMYSSCATKRQPDPSFEFRYLEVITRYIRPQPLNAGLPIWAGRRHFTPSDSQSRLYRP
jgi:hypothetical protein